jgi:hypothetical protein
MLTAQIDQRRYRPEKPELLTVAIPRTVQAEENDAKAPHKGAPDVRSKDYVSTQRPWLRSGHFE